MRVALGDPDSDCIAKRGREEGIGDAMAAKARNALTLFRPLPRCETTEIRLHKTVLYNSLYHADGQLFVNHHAYGIPAAHVPVFCFRQHENGDMFSSYLESFQRVWASGEPIRQSSSGKLNFRARPASYQILFLSVH